MTPPLVSVLLPVKNGAAYLAAALDSLRGQSFRDFELLVIDDASTDATPTILAAAAQADPRLRLLANPGNGLVAALNFGLRQLAPSSAYIARMDADDVAEPQRLERQLTAFTNRPQLALVGTACRLIDAEGRDSGLRLYPEEPAALRAALAKSCCIAHPSVMLRRAALATLEPYRPCFLHAEDYDLWLRLAERYDCCNLPEPLLRYRLHGGQISAQHTEQRILSALAAQALATYRRTQAGAEPVLPARADRALLQAAGWTPKQIAEAIARRAMGAAYDAMAQRRPRDARHALRVALDEPRAPWRARLRALLAWVQSYAA